MRGRGGSRGRGGFGGGRRGPQPYENRKQFQPHVPFDMAHCEDAFPKVSPVLDDKPLAEALLKLNQELSPSIAEQTAIAALVQKIQTSIDGLVATPDTFEAAGIEESRVVGSYKKGTMLAGKNTADIVVILRTLPTLQAVSAFAARVLSDIKGQAPKDISELPGSGGLNLQGQKNKLKVQEGRTLSEEQTDQTEDGAHVVSLIPTDRGFSIMAPDATVNCLIATIPPNIKQLDPELHLPAKMLNEHLAAIRHARWFEETASHSSVKMLIRIVKDLRRRIPGLSVLNPWSIDLLGHHAIMSNPKRTPLSLNAAFRRVLSLLSSGMFLPGSIGILDPCEMGTARVHTSLSLEQMDQLCMTGQTLLRVLAHGGYKQILETDGASADILNYASQWEGGVVVTPSQPLYEPPAPATTEAPEATAAS